MTPTIEAADAVRVGIGDQEARLYRRVALRLIPFLCLCFLLSYLDRINIGFARLQMESDLGWNASIYGLGAGLFFVGYILFEIPSNLILTRVGARIWIARIMISWGLVSGLTALVTEAWHFYALRFLLGFAEAGFLPGVLYYLTTWFPAARRGRMIALFMIGLPISNMLGAPLSGWIMQAFHGAGGFAGWQWLFVIEAVPTVLVGIATVFVLPDGIGDAKWLTAGERALLDERLTDDRSKVPAQNHGFGGALGNPRVWILGAIDFSILLTTYAIGFWLPSFIRDAGISDTLQIGGLTSITSIAGVCGMLVGGYSSDHFRERRWHIVVPFVVTACSLIASTFFTKNVALTVAFFSVANFCVLSAIPVFFSLPGLLLQGPAAAAGFALIISIASVAGVVANTLTGYVLVLTGSASLAIGFFAGCLLLSCVAVLSVPARLVSR